jgi:hypothetical protein
MGEAAIRWIVSQGEEGDDWSNGLGVEGVI